MRYSEKNTRLQSATKGDFIWNGPVETNNQTRRSYYYWTVNAVTRRWQLTQGDRRRGRRRKKQWHRDRASIFFGLSCYCFSSSFSFPRLRFPPHYVSQHIIGLSVCECVCVWSHGMESVVNPLVWPGTQGHLALSRSLSVSLSLVFCRVQTSTRMTSSRHRHCLFVCWFVYLVTRGDKTSGSVSRTRNILLNTFRCPSFLVSNILLSDELLDSLTFSEDTIQ